MKMIGMSIRSLAMRFCRSRPLRIWKRNVKYEAARDKDSWAAEKFLCGREYFRLPAFAANQQPAGSRVRIKTKNPDALKAIHEFLRFQIEDHHTGDRVGLP